MVENVDVASRAMNHAGILQQRKRLGYGGTPAAQQLAERSVRERQRVRVGAVVSHEQPVGSTMLHAVESVAPSEGRNLRQKTAAIAAKRSGELRADRDYAPKVVST